MVNFALTLLLLVLPLAVAGQNIGILISGLLLLFFTWRQGLLSVSVTNVSNRMHLVLFGLYGLTCLFSTWLNPDNSENAFVACGGFLGIWFLPVLVNTALERNADTFQSFLDRSRKWFPFFVLLWGVIALSQMLFSWKLSGISIVSTLPRAQGFYSHPLTLAYVALVLFPFATGWFLRQPKKLAAAAFFVGILFLLIASKSRTVQAVSFAILLWNVWMMLKGRVRIAVVAMLFGSLVTVMATKNPVSSRFHQMIEAPDSSGDRFDDRVVFWEVHWQMFKEKPFLGHGENLGTAYRTPYYESLGYQDFPRKYEAHNLLLQILVNTGVVGLSFFVFWLGWMVWVFCRAREIQLGLASLQSVVALLLGGMTQNAFQDSEVRYAFMLVVMIAVMFSENLRRHGSHSGEILKRS